MIEFVRNLDWEDLWIAWVYVFCSGLLVLAFMGITTDSSPVGTYLNNYNQNNYCVINNRPWSEDTTAACFVDADKALEYSVKLNAEYAKVKR